MDWASILVRRLIWQIWSTVWEVDWKMFEVASESLRSLILVKLSLSGLELLQVCFWFISHLTFFNIIWDDAASSPHCHSFSLSNNRVLHLSRSEWSNRICVHYAIVCISYRNRNLVDSFRQRALKDTASICGINWVSKPWCVSHRCHIELKRHTFEMLGTTLEKQIVLLAEFKLVLYFLLRVYFDFSQISFSRHA